MTSRILIALCAATLAVQPVLAQPRHGHWEHGFGRPGGFHGPHGGDFGAGVFGGIIGGAIGNLFFPREVVVVPQQAPEIAPGTPAWYAYCANKYRSFDAATGTYLGFDGLRHACN